MALPWLLNLGFGASEVAIVTRIEIAVERLVDDIAADRLAASAASDRELIGIGPTRAVRTVLADERQTTEVG
jgi:hypothetical protein